MDVLKMFSFLTQINPGALHAEISSIHYFLNALSVWYRVALGVWLIHNSGWYFSWDFLCRKRANPVLYPPQMAFFSALLRFPLSCPALLSGEARDFFSARHGKRPARIFFTFIYSTNFPRKYSEQVLMSHSEALRFICTFKVETWPVAWVRICNDIFFPKYPR